MYKLKRITVLCFVFLIFIAGCSKKGNAIADKEQTKSNTTEFKDENINTLDRQQEETNAADTMLLERDFLLPDAVGSKETLLSILLNGRQGIEVFSRKQTEQFYQYVLRDGNWKKRKLQFPEQAKESAGLDRAEIIYGEDGRYYIFYALSDESYHLQVTDDFNRFEEITPPEWLEEREPRFAIIPERIRVSENGTLCAALMHYGVCRFYDLKNEGSIEGEIEIGYYNGMEICGNYILNHQGDNKGNYIYDIEKQKIIVETDSYLSGNCIFEMKSADEVYACNENGIYQLASGKWQQLVDSSLNSLSDPGLLRLSIRHVDDRIYIQYIEAQKQYDGKYKEGAVMKSYEYSTDIPKLKATLTIWALEENAVIRRVIPVFRKKYPDVRVIFEVASDVSGVQTTEDIIRQFNAGFYAGDGPDLILLDGLPGDAYEERGLLYDLSQDMAEVKEELLPAVKKLIEEKPYAVPLRIAVPVIEGDKQLLTDSLKEILGNSEKYRTPEMSAEELAGVCYGFFSEGFALNEKDVTIERLEDFFKLCKEASEKWMLNESHKWVFDQEDGGGVPQLLTGQADFNFSYAYGLNQIQYFLNSVEQTGLDYRIVGNRFLPNGMLALNRDSSNKELAVALIREALSREIQEQDEEIEHSDGFPVNETAFDAWAGRTSNMIVGGSDIGGANYYVQKWPSQEIIARFLNDIKKADYVTWRNQYVQKLVMKAAVDVIHGQEDAYASAGKIMNQLELYYDE